MYYNIKNIEILLLNFTVHLLLIIIIVLYRYVSYRSHKIRFLRSSNYKYNNSKSQLDPKAKQGSSTWRVITWYARARLPSALRVSHARAFRALCVFPTPALLRAPHVYRPLK